MSLRDIPGLEGLAPLRASRTLRVLRTLLLWSAFALWLKLVWLALDTLAQHATSSLAWAWSWLN